MPTGPYWQWTRKVAGKTVTRLVPDEQLDDYRQWLGNHRRLRALVAELEALPWPSPTQARSGNVSQPPVTPGKPPPNTVAAAGLTCGHAPQQRQFPQVTAKCEDLTPS